ncbi:MAG: glycosyltransferase family 39 protein [Chitinophagaceae bacterium]|nr:glycosyltransferase family 39 protein [Chitinophagaceae bacterium]
MKTFLQKNHRSIFLLSWLTLTLMQAGLTELQDDEAYYWVFSKFPDWGYFDHPPMTAILIKAGYFLSGSVLGVRLLFVLLNLLTLLIAEKLTEQKNPFLFYGIVLSIAVLHLAGFYAVPDTALIFFTAVFFWRYRSFMISASFLNTICLGLSIALLFYTKYHALLIVLFTLLSNMRLFFRAKAWLAVLVAFILFTPHILWEYSHDWVSIRYHLFESNVNAYKISFTSDYLLGQLLLAGPIAGIILIPAAFLLNPSTYTEKAMKYTLIGLYIFFFCSSFRGKVEPNWTSAGLVPLIILAHRSLQQRPVLLKWLWRIVPLSILLILFGRIIMIEDLLPVRAIQQRFHTWKKWPEEMKTRTKGLPVIFSNSYQRASKYWFYSGQTTYSQNHCSEHKNNYNYWPIEEALLGQPVYFMDLYGMDRFKDSLQTPLGTIGYRYDPSSFSMAAIQFIPEHHSYEVNTGDSILLKGKIRMPEAYHRFIKLHTELDFPIRIYIMKGKAIINDPLLPLHLHDLLKGDFEFWLDPRLPADKLEMIFTIEAPGYNPTHNSARIPIRVVQRSS